MELFLDDMTCGGCVRAVTKTVQTLDASARVQADVETKRVTLQTQAAREQVIAALTEAGFPPRAA
ncbi:heavy-metal-associated domain-containing protein [Sinimarinibacterium sp. NLF-5-8]|uniref:heavy-metal-associated domain-containing protein n=1 Tax=Sinimarinibacterium sp. NLF-5-8 TaxID=2698684 RepID=UPI00137C2EA0|nr:heavy-metal-associated domain-containing protein [Sinimarinibacterium sp. NLF-5-8]